MKKLPTIVLLLMLPFLFGADAAVKVGKKGKLTWDAPTTNEDGTPITDLLSYDLIVAAATATSPDTATVLARATVLVPSVEQLIEGMVPKPPTGSYVAWVRAIDSSGNESAWSNACFFDLDATGPSPPKNPRAVQK